MRRLAWFDNILEAEWAREDEHRKLVVRFGEMITGLDFHKFQDNVLPDEQARKALLSDGAGWVAVAIMSSVVRLLLQGKSTQYLGLCSLLTNSDTGDETKTRENAVCIHRSVVTSVLPSGSDVQNGESGNDDDESTEGGEIHWFFRIELADGELYALDLCTAQFTSVPGEEPWACVAPLDEHLQRLPISEDLSDGWRGMTIHLGNQRQMLEATPTKAPHDEVMAGVIGHDDLCCRAQKFTAVKLEAAVLQMALVQWTSMGKVLRLPAAKFMHTFCTIVWPVELMERELRASIGLTIVNMLRKVAWEATSELDGYLDEG